MNQFQLNTTIIVVNTERYESYRMMEILKALFYEDRYYYSRNRALGMSYLNRFLIEEDAHFECVAPSCILDTFDKTFWQLQLKQINEIETKQCVQFIIAGGHEEMLEVWTRMQQIERMLTLVELKYQTEHPLNVLVTLIGCNRLECVQTDRFKKIYKEGGKIEYESKFLDAYKSVGDDLEDFYQRNKNEMITANEKQPFSLESNRFLRVKGYVFPHEDEMLLL